MGIPALLFHSQPEVVGHAHGAGRVAGHRVDAAVGGAGADRDDRGRLGRQPVEPLTGRHRLARLPGHCRTRTSTLVVDLLVGDRSLDDQHERFQLAAVGFEEPLEEVVRPASGPHSKSISGQCTAILGRPGRAPRAISSMLGWVAAVNATESPSQLRPALIHSTWINVSSALTAASVGMPQLSELRAGEPCANGVDLRPTYAALTIWSTPAFLTCQRKLVTSAQIGAGLPDLQSSDTSRRSDHRLSPRLAIY